MDKLSPAHKLQLFNHIVEHNEDTFEVHALWATNNFNIPITSKDCFELYLTFKKNGTEPSNKPVATGIDALTDKELALLIGHMKVYEDDDWVQHSLWMYHIFDKTITADECRDLYMKAFIYGNI